MDQETLKTYEKQIRSIIEETEQQNIDLADSNKPIAPSSALGRLTRMDAISNREIQQAMLGTSRKRLEALKNALERIHSGTYGICVRCRREISEGRLSAVPEALVCMKCLEAKKR